MKYLSLLLVLLLSFLFLSCNENPPTEVKTEENNKGEITLKIDRANAPQNVAVVYAYLKRADHETIYRQLDLLNDSSADITFEDIKVGVWHLFVEAKNSEGTVIYAGDAEVVVQENFITYINLTLMPTGNGTGTIYLFVTWHNSATIWTDHPTNPLLTAQNNQFDFAGVQQPKILFENGKYRMWYLMLGNSSVSHVGYAESFDGIDWTRPYSPPVLSPSMNAWDYTASIAGAIIKENNTYRMYYVGWGDQNGNWHIGLATSSDGIVWEKHPHPVIYGTSGWEFQVVPSSILKINGVYHLYYYGRSNSGSRIALATSSDGINWTKFSGNPILTAQTNWEGGGIAHPTVIKDPDGYKMVYMNSAGTAFGMATSVDGIYWMKNSTNPIFKTTDTANSWGIGGIAYPFLIKTDNQYRIYYSGLRGGYKYSIGFMKK